jgi:hypothetical protein
MKRVLDQTPPWVVVPVSVLGASLLLALAHWLSDSDSGTPPVARHKSVAVYGDPAPHPLSRMEGDSAESAEASDALSTYEGTDSPQCLASSDAVSVLTSVDSGGQVNTGWLPMNSTGAVLARPIPLLSISGKIPQAQVARPSPRYASNASEWEELPLVAPIEETHQLVEETSQPVETPALGLIDSLFLPPAMKRDLSPSHAQVEPVLIDAHTAVAVEETLQLTQTRPEPLPPVETPEVAPAEPNSAMPDVFSPLPPVETDLVGQFELTDFEAGEDSVVSGSGLVEGAFASLPPVEADLAGPFELPPLVGS